MPKERPTTYKIIFFELAPAQLPFSMLEPAQQEVMNFIEKYFNAFGRFPSLQKICDGEIMGQQIIKRRSGKANVSFILDRLVTHGHLGKAEKNGRGCWTTISENEEWTGPKKSNPLFHN